MVEGAWKKLEAVAEATAAAAAFAACCARSRAVVCSRRRQSGRLSRGFAASSICEMDSRRRSFSAW